MCLCAGIGEATAVAAAAFLIHKLKSRRLKRYTQTSSAKTRNLSTIRPNQATLNSREKP